MSGQYVILFLLPSPLDYRFLFLEHVTEFVSFLESVGSNIRSVCVD